MGDMKYHAESYKEGN